jgi:hypothetical protein
VTSRGKGKRKQPAPHRAPAEVWPARRNQVSGELLSTLELAEAEHVEGIPSPASVDAKFDRGGCDE